MFNPTYSYSQPPYASSSSQAPMQVQAQAPDAPVLLISVPSRSQTLVLHEQGINLLQSIDNPARIHVSVARGDTDEKGLFVWHEPAVNPASSGDLFLMLEAKEDLSDANLLALTILLVSHVFIFHEFQRIDVKSLHVGMAQALRALKKRMNTEQPRTNPAAQLIFLVHDFQGLLPAGSEKEYISDVFRRSDNTEELSRLLETFFLSCWPVFSNVPSHSHLLPSSPMSTEKIWDSDFFDEISQVAKDCTSSSKWSARPLSEEGQCLRQIVPLLRVFVDIFNQLPYDPIVTEISSQQVAPAAQSIPSEMAASPLPPIPRRKRRPRASTPPEPEPLSTLASLITHTSLRSPPSPIVPAAARIASPITPSARISTSSLPAEFQVDQAPVPLMRTIEGRIIVLEEGLELLQSIQRPVRIHVSVTRVPVLAGEHGQNGSGCVYAWRRQGANDEELFLLLEARQGDLDLKLLAMCIMLCQDELIVHQRYSLDPYDSFDWIQKATRVSDLASSMQQQQHDLTVNPDPTIFFLIHECLEHSAEARSNFQREFDSRYGGKCWLLFSSVPRASHLLDAGDKILDPEFIDETILIIESDTCREVARHSSALPQVSEVIHLFVSYVSAMNELPTDLVTEGEAGPAHHGMLSPAVQEISRGMFRRAKRLVRKSMERLQRGNTDSRP